MLDFLSARLAFPVFSNGKRHGVTVMPTREEVLQIEAVQMEPARAHWQRCRLVPARTEGGRSAFSRERGAPLLFYLFCPRFRDGYRL